MDAKVCDSSAALPSRPTAPCQLQRDDKLALAAAVIFVLPWSVFVAGGFQFAYLMALASATTAAALLAWWRSWLAVLFVVALATIVGTEARGELGRGTALLGSLRLLDAALLAAGAGLFGRHIVDTGLRRTGRALIQRSRAMSVEGWIVIAAVVWATVLWIANGAGRDALLRTDVRLILLTCGTYFLARAVVPGQWSRFVLGLLALAPLLALKSALIYATGLSTVGTGDRLQAVTIEVPTRRVLLVGGDTLLILAPALAMAMALQTESRGVRGWCTLTGISAVGGVLLSGTRTNLLVAVALLIGTLCVVMMWHRRLRVTQLSAAAGVLIVLGTATGVYISGLAERLVTADEPHVGLNFRRDEIESATRLPQAELLFGQGLGGSFISRDIRGAAVETGWSHVLPIWIVLKVGLLGLVALLCALGLVVRRVARNVRHQRDGPALTGGLLIVGLILMSLTINRLGQPEGAMLVAIAAVLINVRREFEARCD